MLKWMMKTYRVFSNEEKLEALYLQKSFEKRRFRRFTGKPVRKVRRFYKKRGAEWARQGKGKGKGRRTFMFGDFDMIIAGYVLDLF